MSYYSNVMISIRKKDYDRLIKEIKKLDDLSWREENCLIETIWKSATFLYPKESEFYDDYALLHFKKIKWDSEEIKGFVFFKNYIFNLDEFQFIRIGKNHDDIEEIEKGTDSNLHILRLKRKIIIDC